jgi:phosphatidylglycerophosphate synthase
MISRAEIVKRSRRHNYEENVWLHPFSSHFSHLFTWAFINLGLSANHVTALAFVAGVASALLLLGDQIAYAIGSFVFFRLHVLLDMSDGEVARYRGQVSRFGVYWDQLMHAFTFPLILACLVMGRLISGGGLILLGFALVGMIGTSTDLAVKNVYYRMLYTSGQKEDVEAGDERPTARTFKLRALLVPLLHLSSFDGLLFFYALAYLVDVSWLGLAVRDWVVAVYSVNFAVFAITRMILTARRDRLPMRRDFRG